MTRLSGKVAVITGAAGGIGAATAEVFLREQAKVVLVDLSAERLEELAADLAAIGTGELITVTADVSAEGDVENYVTRAVDAFGRIDVLFNNAGIEGRVAPLIEQSVEDFDALYAVNVRGIFLGLKHVLPVMARDKSGSVINMSSVAGLKGSPGIGPYAATKHAVVGLTKTAALEAAGDGVRVNSIHPSAVDTRMMRALEAGTHPDDRDAARAYFTGSIPLGRYAAPQDVAELALFLASDASRFITGSQYRVDGGLGAR